MTKQEFLHKYQKVPVTEVENSTEGKNPLVSVSVQAYQHEKYIRKCLDGILMQQTSFPFEILIGDDGSTDGTREICLEYAQKYPDKIRLFLHKRENNIAINGKASGRFNLLHSLYHVRGKYFARCEGDDYWTDPLKLQKQVDFLEDNSDYAGTYTNFHKCSIDGEIIQESVLGTDQPEYFDELNVFGKYSSQTLTVMYRNIPSVVSDLTNEVFMKFINADRVISVLMAQQGKIKFLDFNSGVYRWGSGLHSSELTDHKVWERLELYKGFKSFFTNNPTIISEINSIMNEYYTNAVVRYLLRGKAPQAVKLNKARQKETGIKYVNWIKAVGSYLLRGIAARTR